ncbi:MAG: hypothetical protein GC192_23480 [Bacteroidetes bacterium]|nr:hypothetical protein [Bacteroidota bacterium]
MARNNISITRKSGQLGRKATNLDGVIGFIGNGVAVASKLTLGVIYKCYSIDDVEALGLDATYDSDNTVLLYHHLQRLYHWNPSAEVHLMVLAQTATMADMVDIANTSNAKKLSKDSGGRVKMLCVNRNPASGYTPTLATGLDADVIAAITKAQALVEEEASENREISVFLEGRSFNGTAASALDLRTKDAEGVSVVIAADNDISGGDALYNGYAAIGDFAGMISKAAVSRTCCEPVEEFNLLDEAKGYWQNVGLSSNAKLSTFADSSLTTLDDKGFIFADPVPDLTGAWFNDTHTCVLATSDYAFIENNRTINKMIRLARKAILPYVKGRLQVDPDTGYLDPHQKSSLEDMVADSLEVMKTDGDLSGDVDCYINEQVNLLAGDTLVVEITGVPVAIGRSISLKVGFNNPF